MLKRKSGQSVYYTRQDAAMWEELRSAGVYRVKEAYIRRKYDTITSYYTTLYRWYTRAAARYLSIPEGAEYPVWFSLFEENMLQPVPGTVILTVSLPEEKVLLCNYDGWGYVVNYWYVPLNDADAQAHRAELKRAGIASDDELFLTDKGNFYPLLKRKVRESWGRIFTLMPESGESGLAATVWEVRREWVRDVREFQE